MFKCWSHCQKVVPWYIKLLNQSCNMFFSNPWVNYTNPQTSQTRPKPSNGHAKKKSQELKRSRWKTQLDCWFKRTVSCYFCHKMASKKTQKHLVSWAESQTPANTRRFTAAQDTLLRTWTTPSVVAAFFGALKLSKTCRWLRKTSWRRFRFAQAAGWAES